MLSLRVIDHFKISLQNHINISWAITSTSDDYQVWIKFSIKEHILFRIMGESDGDTEPLLKYMILQN